MRLAIPKLAFLAAFWFATAASLSAQTLTTIFNFKGSNGESPEAELVQGLDGYLYGTTPQGGAYGGGTLFKISTTGQLTTLHSFCSPPDDNDGCFPAPQLALTADGTFYGTTGLAGAYGWGTVFRITPQGHLTTVYSFCSLAGCADGADPLAGVAQANDGNFYGTTFLGGSGGGVGNGTIFEVTPQGKLTTLYDFFCTPTDCSDGSGPQAVLVQAVNGNFYGTIVSDKIFEVTPAGQFTTLYTFCSLPNCADGNNPYGALIQASNGIFYGTTQNGGGTAYCPEDCGTVFEATSSGKVSTLYDFCSQIDCVEGYRPVAALIQASDGNLYGTAEWGGRNNGGTIFKITTQGELTALYSFCSLVNCDDGTQPSSSLFQATDGNFYGTVSSGGKSGACYGGCGTIFSLSVGLGPFVETLPTSGKAGAKIIILGNNLTGSTAVTFNGKSAIFTVVSDTEITATVPSGAVSGTVKVDTPDGVLKSNVAFVVAK